MSSLLWKFRFWRLKRVDKRRAVNATLIALKNDKVGAVHLKGCKCVVCTYDYPDKESLIELEDMKRSMPIGTVIKRGYD